MPEKTSRYTKLPGRSAGWFGVTRLWKGDDHLISVSSTLGFENYQRFYFRDIEALIVQRTYVRLIWNCLFGTVAAAGGLLAALLVYALSKEGGDETFQTVALWFIGVPSALALVGLITNTLRGATCAVWVQTAGGMERLGSPVRLRVARRVLASVVPLIEQTQADVSRPAAATTSQP